MFKRPVEFLYGIRIIALWMLIPFVLAFIPELINEYNFQMTTQEVTLGDEIFSYYPDEYKCFESDVNGHDRGVHAPVTSKTGDKITVILRNGEYYMTPRDEQTLNSYTTFWGRFRRVTNNKFGAHVVGFAAALLVSFLITFRRKKEIREIYPKLSKITNIGGIISCVIMAGTMVYYVIDGTLTAVGIICIGMLLGMIYTGISILGWVTECTIMAKAKPA